LIIFNNRHYCFFDNRTKLWYTFRYLERQNLTIMLLISFWIFFYTVDLRISRQFTGSKNILFLFENNFYSFNDLGKRLFDASFLKNSRLSGKERSINDNKDSPKPTYEDNARNIQQKSFGIWIFLISKLKQLFFLISILCIVN
jgi:hypothetical protein